MDVLTIRVLGVPAPQGSHTRMPNGAMLNGSSKTGRAKHKAWRTAVTETARETWGDQPPLDGPLYLSVTFRFPMPKSRPAATRRAGIGWHTTRPDLDKVLRTTLDALTDAGTITDDARVCSIVIVACEVTGWTGCDLYLGPAAWKPEP
jgi:Holliday junction resolvase RusA-like endonuclease